MDNILYGADYNPEQWKNHPEILEEDIRLMKKAGCNVMSVGIFAWSEIEPEEGTFDFSFFDGVLDKLYANGIRVFFATPSGARPAWMSMKYPEILRTDEKGIKQRHGGRHNHCFTSPIYREKVKIINTEIAKHFGSHPAVLGWHVSNEYNGECHCDLCKEAFRAFLKNRYQTLDKLNEQWWTTFWSHTYTDWNQIEPPSSIGENGLHGLVLDWKRFVTYQTLDFYREEIKPLKEFAPDILVTTNFHDCLGHLDYWKFKDDVDMISWDLYPEWRGNSSDGETMIKASFIYDMCRSFKKAPFLLMESTPSNVNWRGYAKLKENGFNILSSMQAVACGANSVQYFQWRKSRGSSEKFHGAVVDHYGKEDTRVFREVTELGKHLASLSEIATTNVSAKAAVIFDCESKWALEASQGFVQSDKKYENECVRHYREFVKRGISVDVIDSEQDFSGYEIIAAPMLYMLKPGVAKRLKDFVHNGGTLICGYATGYVNDNDLCFLGGFPGDGLMDLFGIWNEEIDTLYPQQKKTVSYLGTMYSAIDYYENIHLKTAESMGLFQNGMFAGNTAVSLNQYGKGKAYYLAFRDEDDFLSDFYNTIIEKNHPFGEDVYVKCRENHSGTYYFIQNWNDSDCVIQLEKEYRDLLNDKTVTGQKRIASFETVILFMEK